jgi:hypothetical protein
MRYVEATFHWAGKYPRNKAELNSWVRYLIPMGGNALRMRPVIRL